MNANRCGKKGQSALNLRDFPHFLLFVIKGAKCCQCYRGVGNQHGKSGGLVLKIDTWKWAAQGESCLGGKWEHLHLQSDKADAKCSPPRGPNNPTDPNRSHHIHSRSHKSRCDANDNITITAEKRHRCNNMTTLGGHWHIANVAPGRGVAVWFEVATVGLLLDCWLPHWQRTLSGFSAAGLRF